MSAGGRTKVLTITTSGLVRKDGISTVILDNYKKLDIRKYDLQITASGEYDSVLVEAFQNIGVVVRYLPSRKRLPKDYFQALVRLIKEERYSVIYIHGSSAIMAIELLIAKRLGCGVRIAHSQNTTCDHKKLDKLLRPVFYQVVTNRLACGNAAGRWLYGNRSFTVLQNGRDPKEYRFDADTRERVRKELGLSDRTTAIGHVGNFNEQKNQTFLIDVFKQIHRKNPDTKLFLVGDGGKRSEVMQKASMEGLSDSVVFTGSVSNVPEILQAMDVMVLPSLYEGLPLVVVEWQMAGLPCILSDKVTKECSFTDLVSFMSLDATKEEWADKILSAAGAEREMESKKGIEAANAAGFDINTSALILDKVLSGGV